jgi:hypothetical protein
MADSFDKPFSTCTIEIKRDEDWRDAVVLRRLMANGAVTDFDFTQIERLDLYVRPVFDHSILIHQLSSTLAGGNQLSFDPLVPGELKIEMSRASVIASIPTGHWDQFLVATYLDGSIEEFWRGPLLVHPGKISS